MTNPIFRNKVKPKPRKPEFTTQVEEWLYQKAKCELSIRESVNIFVIREQGRDSARRGQPKKRSVYFHSETIREVTEIAIQKGTTISQLLQWAWNVSKPTIKKYPSNQ